MPGRSSPQTAQENSEWDSAESEGGDRLRGRALFSAASLTCDLTTGEPVRFSGMGYPVASDMTMAEAKQHDARDKQSALAEAIAGAPAQEQKASEDQRVGVEDPGEALLREPEIALDRRERLLVLVAPGALPGLTIPGAMVM